MSDNTLNFTRTVADELQVGDVAYDYNAALGTMRKMRLIAIEYREDWRGHKHPYQFRFKHLQGGHDAVTAWNFEVYTLDNADHTV